MEKIIREMGLSLLKWRGYVHLANAAVQGEESKQAFRTLHSGQQLNESRRQKKQERRESFLYVPSVPLTYETRWIIENLKWSISISRNLCS